MVENKEAIIETIDGRRHAGTFVDLDNDSCTIANIEQGRNVIIKYEDVKNVWKGLGSKPRYGRRIELEAAKEMKLELRNRFQMPGAGERTVDAWETEMADFSIGGKSFTKRRFYVLPLKEIKEGLNLPFLDGIIGYDFFGTSVLQIDYPSKTASFLSEYKGENGVPFSIRGSHVPKLAVEVDGIKSDFVIDTGDRSQLTLGRTFSERVLQGTRYGLSEEKVTGYGLGGPIVARTFELDSIRFGAVEARKVVTRIPNVKSGAFAQSDFTGSIGSGLLKTYQVTFDYQNKLFYAE